MTLLGPLFAPRALTAENPAVPLTSTTLLELFGGKPTTAGVPVTEVTALGMPAVYRAVNLIAGTAAGLPLHAFTRGDLARTPLTEGIPAQILYKPHPDLIPFDFWELVYSHRLLWGNAYVLKLRNQMGRLAELWPIHPSRVRAGRESETGRKIYAVDGGDDAGGMTLYDDKIMHLPAFGYDGICGVSPVRIAREGIGLALSAEAFGAQLFGNGSLATGILQTEQRLTKEQADALHARWKEKAAGLANAHEAIVLDRGAKFQQLTIPPEDAQFLESRKFQVVEIARMFGVPPHMLMDVEGSTSWGTGIEQQTIGFKVFSLQPWLIRTEQRITFSLFEGTDTYAKYALDGLLRGDSAARGAFYKIMWELGALSTNDIRAYEELPPVEGGDQRFRPLNFGSLVAEKVAEDAPEVTDKSAETARAVAEIAQKMYLAVDGNKMLTVDEGRTLLVAAGAEIDPTSPFEAEPAPVPVPDPTAPVPELEPA